MQSSDRSSPSSEDKLKPRLRGIPDLVAVTLALPAAALLVAYARDGVAMGSALVYGLCVVLLFGISAGYHVPMWPKRVLGVMRRLDHSAIYFLIAGTYTPVCFALEGAMRERLLAIVWVGAALGVLKTLLWPRAPRWLTAVVYVALGWVVIVYIPVVLEHIGLINVVLFAVGGVAYTLGALIYTKRWPNPWPKVFGYHEVFHLFVIGAAASHFVAVWSIVT